MQRAGVTVVSVVGIKWKVLEEKVDRIYLITLGCDMNDVMSVLVFQKDIGSSADKELDNLIVTSVSGEMNCGKAFRVLLVDEFFSGRNLDLTCDAFPVNF